MCVCSGLLSHERRPFTAEEEEGREETCLAFYTQGGRGGGEGLPKRQKQLSSSSHLPTRVEKKEREASERVATALPPSRLGRPESFWSSSLYRHGGG